MCHLAYSPDLAGVLRGKHNSGESLVLLQSEDYNGVQNLTLITGKSQLSGGWTLAHLNLTSRQEDGQRPGLRLGRQAWDPPRALRAGNYAPEAFRALSVPSSGGMAREVLWKQRKQTRGVLVPDSPQGTWVAVQGKGIGLHKEPLAAEVTLADCAVVVLLRMVFSVVQWPYFSPLFFWWLPH